MSTVNQRAKAQTSDIVIIATATAKPGKEQALEAALMDAAAPTRVQKGSVAFTLLRPRDNSNVIMGIERWSSNEDHARHLQGAHIQKLFAALADVLAGPPAIVSYTIVNDEI
jgi:quinol monooxygenase YgiN